MNNPRAHRTLGHIISNPSLNASQNDFLDIFVMHIWKLLNTLIWKSYRTGLYVWGYTNHPSAWFRCTFIWEWYIYHIQVLYKVVRPKIHILVMWLEGGMFRGKMPICKRSEFFSPWKWLLCLWNITLVPVHIYENIRI